MKNKDSLPTRSARSKPIALLAAAVAFGFLLLAGRAEAAEYYVAPTGSDSNAGSMAAPFATLQKGNDVAAAGDTVWIRGGTYQLTKQIKLSKSGQSDTQRIKYWAYAQEVPILDFSGYVSTNTAADVPQILVTGNWIHLRGLEIANGKVGASGAHSNSALRSEGASNNTFERLNIHHNFGPGLFISKGTGGNLILNCDSHDNYDKDGSQGDGQNGDGFGVHYQTTGPSTIIRGCRAWVDSDDGYDLISQEVPVTIENSWAIQNGYANGGSVSPSSGNGNGFKVGSSDTGIRHLVQNCVAWKNKAAGFYANHSSGGNTWLNNTSYMNGTQYNMLASPSGDTSSTITLTGALAHKMRNNIGFPNKNANMGGVDTTFNTWDLGITEASSDFASTSDTGATGPRQADGSLPNVDFLKLKAGSPLIDKGTNVGLPFDGSAPDLGAYEYGAVATTGTGGTPGSGGSSAGGSANGGSANGGASAGGTNKGGATAAGGVNAGGSAISLGGSSMGGATLASGGANANTGGNTTPTGGVQGSGGTATVLGGSGPSGNGGSAANVAGSSATAGASSLPPTEASGCSCSTPRRGNDLAGAALAGLMFSAWGLRRRARRAARVS